MKITKVDVMIMDLQPEDNKTWKPVLCRVYTDAGIYGDGEAAMAYGCGSTGAFSTVVDFAKKIVGMDPLQTELIWETLYKETFWDRMVGQLFSLLFRL